MAELAILGGEKEVPDGTIKKWPPIEDTDREMVMASLEGENHSFGPNCVGLTKIVTTEKSQLATHSRTRLKCPSCNAPMVGTRPIDCPDCRVARST